MLMSNRHIDLVVVFGVEYLLVWLLPELVLVGFFHEYPDGSFVVLYGAASLEVRKQLLQSDYRLVSSGGASA